MFTILRKRQLIAYVFAVQLLFAFATCEGIVEGNGWVYDDETRLPLPGVSVSSDMLTSPVQTDSLGHFDFSSGIVGCMCKCPDVHVSLSLAGYQSLQVKNPFGDTLFLKK